MMFLLFNPKFLYHAKGLIIGLLIGFSLSDTDALYLDKALESLPPRVNVSDISKQFYNSAGNPSASFLNVNNSMTGFLMFSCGLRVVLVV